VNFVKRTDKKKNRKQLILPNARHLRWPIGFGQQGLHNESVNRKRKRKLNLILLLLSVSCSYNKKCKESSKEIFLAMPIERQRK
jgi:hypothetical protein